VSATWRDVAFFAAGIVTVFVATATPPTWWGFLITVLSTGGLFVGIGLGADAIEAAGERRKERYRRRRALDKL
jgi:hypothetical protein